MILDLPLPLGPCDHCKIIAQGYLDPFSEGFEKFLRSTSLIRKSYLPRAGGWQSDKIAHIGSIQSVRLCLPVL